MRALGPRVRIKFNYLYYYLKCFIFIVFSIFGFAGEFCQFCLSVRLTK